MKWGLVQSLHRFPSIVIYGARGVEKVNSAFFNRKVVSVLYALLLGELATGIF